MIDEQLGVTARRLRQQRDELLTAIEPFIVFNSSEDTVTVKLRTADVTRARAAVMNQRPLPPTDGPWSVGISEGTQHHVEPSICRVWGSADGAANARLIAAAPDLLVALQAILQRFDDIGTTAAEELFLAPARAAIRKATT